MTDYARFANLSQPAGVTWSADRFTATFDGVSRYNTWVASKLTSGKYVFVMTPNAATTVGISDAGDVTSASPVNTVGVLENGAYYTWVGGGATNIGTIPGVSAGTPIMVAFDLGAAMVWFSADGTNWYGASGSALPTSSVVASTGGISLSMITTGCNPSSFLYSGSGTVALNSGASAYPWTPPSGFGNLPQTLNIVSVAAYDGGHGSIVWDDTSCGTLQLVLDGGSPVPAGGTNSGSGGTASNASTFSGINYYNLALTDGANLIDQTNALGFWTPPDPGSATVIASQSGTTTTTTLINGTFTPVDEADFTFMMNEVYSAIVGHVSLQATVGLCVNSALTEKILTVLLYGTAASGTSTVTGTLQVGSGTVPTSGSQTFSVSGPWATEGIYVQSLIQGSLQIDSVTGGNAYGTLTVTSPVDAQWIGQLTADNDLTSTLTIQGWQILRVEGFLSYGVALYGPATEETLTLTSASTPSGGGTLAIVGTVTNATPSNVDISTTGTAGSFTPAASYSLAGGVINASNGMLSPGTYSVAIRDHDNPSFVSNALEVIVSLESISLTSAACVPGGTLTVGGIVLNGTPTDLDISTNGGTAWVENTAFSLSAGTFTASGGTLAAGTYPVVVRDHGQPSVISNVETLVISSESLTLTAAAAALGGAISFGGVSNDGPPANVDISINGTWDASTSFTTASGSTDAAFSGLGPVQPVAGTFVVRVRDHDAPYVISNTLTITIANVETINLESAAGTLGQTLALAGNSYNGPPAGLQVSLDDGATWSATSGYESATGTVAAAWTADGATLSTPGTLVVGVRDSTNTSVVSNFVTLVVASQPETIELTSAVCVIGSPLNLSGVWSYGPVAGMNYSLDGGETFSPTSGYTTGSGILGVAWSAEGEALAIGTYLVCVQDSTNTDVISNIITLTIGGGGGGGGGINEIPNWGAADFFAAFQKLMPRGRAWPLQASAVMNQCLAALMGTYVRVTAAATALLIDGFPATSVNLLPEWEKSVGLPDACTPLGSSISQQQAAVVEKFTRGGGQSVPYYYSVAARLGYGINIVEGSPGSRTWTIHAPVIAQPTVFRAGDNRAGDLLETIQGNDQLECVFNQIKPADTILIFSYP